MQPPSPPAEPRNPEAPKVRFKSPKNAIFYPPAIPHLGGRFGYFIFFLLRGGKGGVQGDREGGRSQFFIENPMRGGFSQEGVEGGEGARRVSAGNLGELGGGGRGPNIFGAEMPAKPYCNIPFELLGLHHTIFSGIN